MGNCLAVCRNNRTSRKVTLVILGLDNAGKTSTMKGLQGEPLENVAPTVGFGGHNEVTMNKCDVNLIDLGGGKNIRGIWKNYYAEAHGVIYVLDASEERRLSESKSELENLLANNKIAGKPLLVLANKQDKEGALDDSEISEQLELDDLTKMHKCPTLLKTCSAIQGIGKKADKPIREGVQWLLTQISNTWEDLNPRVEKEATEQREAEAKEKKEKLERVRKIREQREKEEVELKKKTSKPDQTEEDSDDDAVQIGQNPFKPVDQIKFPNGKKEKRPHHKKEIQSNNSEEEKSPRENKKKKKKKNKKRATVEPEMPEANAETLMAAKSRRSPRTLVEAPAPAQRSAKQVEEEDDDDDDLVVSTPSPRPAAVRPARTKAEGSDREDNQLGRAVQPVRPYMSDPATLLPSNHGPAAHSKDAGEEDSFKVSLPSLLQPIDGENEDKKKKKKRKFLKKKNNKLAPIPMNVDEVRPPPLSAPSWAGGAPGQRALFPLSRASRSPNLDPLYEQNTPQQLNNHQSDHIDSGASNKWNLAEDLPGSTVSARTRPNSDGIDVFT